MSTKKPHAPTVTEAELEALVAHCEASPDPLAKQVASAITGAPSGAKAAFGGGLVNKLGPIWDKVGPLLILLLNQFLAKKATPVPTPPLEVPPA